MKRQNPPYSDELGAYCAAQWGSGMRQKAIADAVLRQKNATSVCIMIRTFLQRYADLPTKLHADDMVYSKRRRALVKDALANYVASRG